jgi:DNA-directed RNA polymerase beta' subunit
METGNEAKMDKAEINRLLEAAERGDAIAQNNLGVRCHDGEDVPQDHAKAADWFAKAAEQGNAQAQKNLGLCYYYGEGVPQSYEKAVEWFAEAEKQGKDTMIGNAEMHLAAERIGYVELAVPIAVNCPGKPEGIILDTIPVIHPDSRPAESNLCELYHKVVNINHRVKRLIEARAPDIVLSSEKRMLQEAVNNLLGKCPEILADPSGNKKFNLSTETPL